jgi:response regulator RpfG family c-di-GMP phosphodiesterase
MASAIPIVVDGGHRMTNRNVLLVDDDANVLLGYQRHLRRRFEVTLAHGAEEALPALKDKTFAVVVSDMRMPGMSGVEFLARVKQAAPDTIRMMLTGNADQKTAIDAVNDGAIFRFLTKPCSPEEMGKALEAGVEQFRLKAAESELLCKTLGGTVSVLVELLSLAFGRAKRVRNIVRGACQQLRLDNAWEIEIAAMLSQVGCVQLPPAVLLKVEQGEELTAAERQAYRAHPRVGQQLIAKIPRLEGAADLIGRQAEQLDSETRPCGPLPRSEIGLVILQAALQFDLLTSAGAPADEAYAALSEDTRYHPDALGALAQALDLDYSVERVWLSDLADGMVLDEHVFTRSGEILLAKGRQVNAEVRANLRRHTDHGGIREPIRVRRPTGKGQP